MIYTVEHGEIKLEPIKMLNLTGRPLLVTYNGDTIELSLSPEHYHQRNCPANPKYFEYIASLNIGGGMDLGNGKCNCGVEK